MRRDLLLLFALLLIVGWAGAWLGMSLIGDKGYVLMVWQGWQMQTSLAVALLLVALGGLVLLGGLWLLLGLIRFPLQYRLRQRAELGRRNARLLREAGTYWLLGQQDQANERVAQVVRQPRDALFRAALYRAAGQFEQAEQQLAVLPADQVEWMLLEKAQIALARQQPQLAYQCLQLLRDPAHQLERQHWQPGFDRHLAHLWALCATQLPVEALSWQDRPAAMTQADWQGWLEALGKVTLDDAVHPQLAALYQGVPERLRLRDIRFWLPLLAQFPLGSSIRQEAGRNVQQALRGPFDASLIGLWLRYQEQQAAGGVQVEAEVSQVLMELEQRFPGNPVIANARQDWLNFHPDGA